MNSYPTNLNAAVLQHHIGSLETWSRQCQLPDPVNYRDYVEMAAELARVWVRDSSPDSIEMFPYPKASGSVRQLAIVSPKDHARLRAMSGPIAEVASKVLSQHCYSAKLATPAPNWNFKPHLYFKFIRAALKGIKAWDCVGMVRTDVQAYFPSISMESLLRSLWNAGCDKQSVRDVIQTLLTFQDMCRDLRGLPIGPDACALLGTFFLDPVDAALRPRTRAFYRYMDDMAYLYGQDLAADHGCDLLDEALAALGLSRSIDKTHHAETPAEAMDLMRRRDLASVEAYIQLIPNVPIEPVKAFFDEVVMLSLPVDLAGLRKCLAAFRSARSTHAVYPLLDTPTVFDADPKACANYLESLAASNSDIGQTLARRLMRTDVPAASRVHIMRVLRSGAPDRSLGHTLLSMAGQDTVKTPERVWSVSAYGRSASYDQTDLLDALGGASSLETRRAAILTLKGRRVRGQRYAVRALSGRSLELQICGEWVFAA